MGKINDKETESNTLIGVNVTDNNLKQLKDITTNLYGEDLNRMQSATVRYCINYTHKGLFGDSNNE